MCAATKEATPATPLQANIVEQSEPTIDEDFFDFENDYEVKTRVNIVFKLFRTFYSCRLISSRKFFLLRSFPSLQLHLLRRILISQRSSLQLVKAMTMERARKPLVALKRLANL